MNEPYQPTDEELYKRFCDAVDRDNANPNKPVFVLIKGSNYVTEERT